MNKVLVIEDDQLLRDNLTEMLNLSGYEVLCAPDGKNGIETALKEKPDIILCDVMMPGLDGYGVLHILSRHPDAKRIPFVFLTGKSDLNDLRKGLGMGADDYLIKPLNEVELLHTIDLRLKKSEQLRNFLPVSTHKSGIELPGDFADKLVSEKYEILIYNKKHVLYTADQRAGSVFYVISGHLKEFLLHENGKELITNMYSSGDVIGHTATLEGINYTETVEVIDEAELIVIPSNDFIEIVRSNMGFAQQFLGLLSYNIRKKEEKLLNMAYNSLRQKVAGGIIEVADKFKCNRNGMSLVTISREDLAHIVGSAQESMIRTLKEFKSENLIDIIDGDIVIINEHKLRNLLY